MKLSWKRSAQALAPKTVGPVLLVDLPHFGITSLKAKVDTGAFSGALHADDIHEVSTTKGTTHLRFRPHGSNRKLVTIESYHKRVVKSSNGVSALRYAFESDIVIEDESYPITITLSDRSSMKYPMLIGRKFLQTHGFLVDVSKINQ